jgi:hypothetical protein
MKTSAIFAHGGLPRTIHFYKMLIRSISLFITVLSVNFNVKFYIYFDLTIESMIIEA